MSEILTSYGAEERIYNAYRLALRSFRRADNGSTCRAADRRNRARKVVVDRYNVSFQQVKAIVAKFDELKNIEHPDDPNYLVRLNFLNAREEYRKNPVEACPSCGSTELVDLRINPFEVEINNVVQYMISCFKCYYEVELDI